MPGKEKTNCSERRLVLRAYAKVNLSLEILGQRADGYHELVTVLQTVSLCDRLTLESLPEGGIEVRCDHPAVGSGPDNLAYRAARAFQQALAERRGVRISLAKRIPVGSGLGGGSSDAAATLGGLNCLWSAGWSEEELRTLAAELGSDVPFFLGGGTCLGEGRGERLTPLPSLPETALVLVFPPDAGISTAEVYRALAGKVQAAGARTRALIAALEAGDLEGVIAQGWNDLEAVVFARRPELQKAAEGMRACGLRGVRLTGSGAALYGFVEPAASARLVARLRERLPGYWLRVVEPVSRGWEEERV